MLCRRSSGKWEWATQVLKGFWKNGSGISSWKRNKILESYQREIRSSQGLEENEGEKEPGGLTGSGEYPSEYTGVCTEKP